MPAILRAANPWTQKSIDYAANRPYLDDLYTVYPVVHENVRKIDERIMYRVEMYFNERDNFNLIASLLDLDLFPVKDSYIPFLRKSKDAIRRNPQIINRICGDLYEMGFRELYKRCTEPKEANRQMGPMFRNWLNSGALGIRPVPESVFVRSTGNAILDGSDSSMMDFARRNFGYNREKGLDFIARYNGRYVIGEAKFISDFGGHQNDQFVDAIATIESPLRNNDVVKIGIIDGVPYIRNNGKLFLNLIRTEYNIMSALVLRDFLESL
ncbi:MULTISPECIES: restriction endonuclease [unclassified Fibrobacter]|uniref:restriction endonuclease n=1 Tax=unclassified Fibrobacter TaxID=2634177 RepID=UPI000BD5C77F|nr:MULTISPECIES: restriction endonuclease [unclassified Fibrobacter]SOE53890.1 Tsp45I type II restriction enzyme [Fibrobacter sp. UWT3]